MSPGRGGRIGLEQALAMAWQARAAGQRTRAAAMARQIIGQIPDQPDALYLLAVLAHEAGDAASARGLLDRLLARWPDYAEARHLAALVLERLGEPEAAIAALREALQMRPDWPEAENNLARLLRQNGDIAAAIRCYEGVLARHPDEPLTLFNLGIALHAVPRYHAAADCFRRLVARRPDDGEAWLGLGNVCKDAGWTDEARRAYDEAVRRMPGSLEAGSNRLFLESYNVLCDEETLLSMHRAWAGRFAPPERSGRLPHRRHDGERLRIGYCSPDLRRHPVGTFIEGLLAGHDRGRFELIAYAEVAREDAVTRRLRGLVDGWRRTIGHSDEAVARQIHADGIDILVDLAGHTRGHRLGVFAWRPAPVQLSYLGYCTTTGLEQMDYWLTDAVLTPADTVERTTERIWRLPRCWISYRPPADAPEVAERPADAPLTFGSFNDLSKLGDAVVETWSELLSRVPGSRLLLKAAQLGDAGLRAETEARFARLGIDAGRLDLRGRSRDYLSEYGDMDIALDPFPRTGGATTVDALWMGVPVVSLSGRRFIERQGASLLHAVGLDAFVAGDRAAYLACAERLAGDRAQLADLRRGLRDRVRASPLADGADLARHVERAYEAFWRRWLETGRP